MPMTRVPETAVGYWQSIWCSPGRAMSPGMPRCTERSFDWTPLRGSDDGRAAGPPPRQLRSVRSHTELPFRAECTVVHWVSGPSINHSWRGRSLGRCRELRAQCGITVSGAVRREFPNVWADRCQLWLLPQACFVGAQAQSASKNGSLLHAGARPSCEHHHVIKSHRFRGSMARSICLQAESACSRFQHEPPGAP